MTEAPPGEVGSTGRQRGALLSFTGLFPARTHRGGSVPPPLLPRALPGSAHKPQGLCLGELAAFAEVLVQGAKDSHGWVVRLERPGKAHICQLSQASPPPSGLCKTSSIVTRV